MSVIFEIGSTGSISVRAVGSWNVRNSADADIPRYCIENSHRVTHGARNFWRSERRCWVILARLGRTREVSSSQNTKAPLLRDDRPPAAYDSSVIFYTSSAFLRGSAMSAQDLLKSRTATSPVRVECRLKIGQRSA